MFVKPYATTPEKGERNSGELKVSTLGYVPAEVQINRLIDAGIRLDAYRKGEYEFTADEEVPHDYIDMTREPGFDPADAHQIQMSLTEMFDEKMREKEESEAVKTAAEIVETSQEDGVEID